MDIVTYANLKTAGYTDDAIQHRYGFTNKEWRDTLLGLGVIERSGRKEKDITFWRKEEVDYIRSNFTKQTIKVMSKKLDRSEMSVRYKMRKLGISLRITPKEVAFIKNNYKEMTDKEIAEVLNKPIACIGMKRVRVGCGRVNGEWSEKEERYLLENYRTMSDTEVAYILDRTESSVRGKRGRMHLSKKAR